MGLRERAIQRIEGAGSSGFSDARKLADLYVSTNTNDKGVVSNPGVYDQVMDNILSPFAGTIDGQNLIADYDNKKKKLVSSTNKSESSVESFKQDEYSAWHVTYESGDQDGMSFRRPETVLSFTTDSLNDLLARVSQAIIEGEANGDDTNNLNNYLQDLLPRVSRMNTAHNAMASGEPLNMDGYGYFLDKDPSTGVVRGASFMPTDVGDFAGLQGGKKRSDGLVDIGGQKVPTYMSTLTEADGTEYSVYNGQRYEFDDGILSSDGGENTVDLSDRTINKGIDSAFEQGKIYQTFTGKSNVDGTPRNDYVYVGNDNKIYSFSGDEPQGQEFLASMKGVGVNTDNAPVISSLDLKQYQTEALPSDTAAFSTAAATEQRIASNDPRFNLQAAAPTFGDKFRSLGDKVGSFFGKAGKAFRGADRPEAPAPTPTQTAGSTAAFRGVNRPNQPEQPGQSIDGKSSGADVIDAGKTFFRGKV